MESSPTWACSTCTFANAVGVIECEMCGASRPGVWRCGTCTFVNVAEALACGACGTQLPQHSGKKGKKNQRFRKADHLLGAAPLARVRQSVAEAELEEAWDEEEASEWNTPQKAASHARGHFVQAACRIVAGGEKGWRDVWHIEQPCAEVPKCPICMEEPVLPRISECGHSFCLACVVRHLQDKHSCPICSVGPLLFGDLRPVSFDIVQRPLVGGEWIFVLVRRTGARVGLASQQPMAAGAAIEPSHLAREGDPGWRYSRRLLGDPKARLERMQAEVKQIENADDPALVSVRDQLQDLVVKAASVVDAPEPLFRGSSADSVNDATPMIFYQSEDAQLIFLEPALTKQLLERHGDWGALPQRVVLRRLEGVREELVTEELQWRHRFLSHLLGSEVIFVGGSVEVDGVPSDGPAPDA